MTCIKCGDALSESQALNTGKCRKCCQAEVVRKVETDQINHPQHYTNHPSGIECIQISEHMTFCAGNAIKYIWRAGLKGSKVEDLKKARWYINREIKRLENSK
jgi:Protein of unknwon function (DUF3310)